MLSGNIIPWMAIIAVVCVVLHLKGYIKLPVGKSFAGTDTPSPASSDPVNVTDGNVWTPGPSSPPFDIESLAKLPAYILAQAFANAAKLEAEREDHHAHVQFLTDALRQRLKPSAPAPVPNGDGPQPPDPAV